MGLTIKPLPRGPFIVAGTVLFGLKLLTDRAVSAHFGRTFSPLFYVSPMNAPLFQPREDPTYWFALWAAALPFIVAGVLLTSRRLADARLSPWLVLLFFVPFANLLFFVAAAVAPSLRAPLTQSMPGQPLYRASSIDTTLAADERSVGASVLIAGLAGSVICLGAMGVSVGVMRTYGTALLLGAPVLSGFAASSIFVRLCPRRDYVHGALGATIVTFGISFVVVTAFALEGVACLIMALPLIVPVVFFGSLLGYALAKDSVGRGVAQVSAPFLLMPVLLGAEGELAQPPASDVVVSEVIVDATPEVVWKRVIAFPPLPEPTDLLFRAGIAAPLRATIDGSGPGAVRRCVFTTGTFVEPVVVWMPGRELSFTVTEQPDPMREMTLWNSVRPPHLDRYLESTRGQFVLEPLPGGRTRLIGRTWYRMRLEPAAYFRVWGDAIIHRIHLRVLRHVAALSEADMRAI